MKVGLYQAHFPQMEVDRNYALPPLGLGYLASYARQHLDGGVEICIEQDLESLIAERPDVVGITFVSANAWIAARQAAQVKEALGCPVIAGGPHISTLPTALDPAFDLAVLGEGEATFVELMELFKAEKRFEPASLAKIPGLLYRDGGALARTPARARITDLNTIPYPDRGQMQGKWTHAPAEVQMMTSRGCPYNCSFCSTVRLWGQQYLHPANAYVLGEIEQIRQTLNPKTIHFYDDLFIVRKERTLSLLAAMRERGLHEGMDFTCFVRANLLDDDLMEAFARTNVKTLNIGFESGSDEVLKKLNKQGTSAERNARAIELGRKYGLEFSSCLILGVPGETRNDLLATFDFVRASMDTFRYVEFTMLHVLPGTSVWDEARRQLGVSENNLTGIALEPEDVGDEEHYYRDRWPYLNEANMPREEVLTYYFIGQNISRMIWEFSQMRRKMRALDENTYSPQFAAEHISFSDMLKAKVRRRLQNFMPIGEPPRD